MSDFYGSNRLPTSAHLELTDRCNAGCPLCSRTSRATGSPSVFVRNVDLSSEIIKSRFSADFLRRSHFRYVHICGNYGDPMIHPEALEVARHFVENGVAIGIATNGSLRDRAFWTEFGETLASSNVGSRVTFGIDGVDQETHESYRKFTNLEKILENARAFIRAGGTARWQFIVFDHNEHQIERARKMAAELGFAQFKLQVGNRISPKQSQRTNNADRTDQGISEVSATITDRKGRSREYGITLSERMATATRQSKQYSALTVIEEEIPCKAKSDDSFFVSAEGFVFPCCWTALHYNRLRYASHPNVEETAPLTPSTPEYAWSADTNIYHQSIESILTTRFFSRIAQQLQPGSKNPIWPCFKTCYLNANKEVLEVTNIK